MPIDDRDAVAIEPLSTGKSVTLAAIGATLVGLATYPVGGRGYVDLFVQPDLAEWIGFALRATGSAALGALWGYLHRPETNPMRALQLGMVAPAAIAGMIYANSGDSKSDHRGETSSRIQARSHITNAQSRAAAAIFVADRHGTTIGTLLGLPGQVIPLAPSFVDRVVKGAFGK
jgi:hypothetical protein